MVPRYAQMGPWGAQMGPWKAWMGRWLAPLRYLQAIMGPQEAQMGHCAPELTTGGSGGAMEDPDGA